MGNLGIGTPLTLEDWDQWGRNVATVLNLMPSSGQYLIEDFRYAGGPPALMKEVASHLDLDALTVTGRTVRENIESAENFNPDVIRPVTQPLTASGGIAVLRGNLAPDGAIIKPSAATPELMQHRGRAVVFDTIEE